MNRQDAIITLRLKNACPSSAQISAGFDRLALRYPRQHFPERAQELETARDVLLHPERIVQAILDADTIDLGWLAPFATETRPQTDVISPNTQLAVIVRPVLLTVEQQNHFGQNGAIPDEVLETLKAMGGMPGMLEMLFD